MKIRLLMLALLLLIRFANSQWVQQYSGSSAVFQDVFFINYFTGYLIGTDITTADTSIVYKTSNAGINWYNISVISVFGAQSIYFTSELTGYTVGFGGKIFKTTNGGINWFQQYNPGPNGYLSEIEFIGQDTGYIVGDGGVFLKTTNGGNNWIKYQHYLTYRFNCLDFIDANTGYIAGEHDNDGILIKTTNGGVNWVYRYNLNSDFTGISFCNAFTGYAVGLFGIVYKTTNGGENFPDWEVCGFLSSLYDVKTFNKDTAIVAGGNGYIGRTTNGGINWVIQNYAPSQTLNAVYFLDKDTGYCVGRYGTILKTTNGGVPIGIVPISHEIPDNYQLFQNYPNPFNPNTKIKFDITKHSNVRILIYDLLGREVATLVNEKLNPGSYKVEWDAANYPSGVYYYTLTTGDFRETKKMVLIK